MNFNIIDEKINDAKKIVILTHIIPDGDAVGSACLFAQYLQTIGKDAKVYFQEKLNKDFLKLNIDDLITYQEPKDFDLIICVDCANSDRLGKYEPLVKSSINSIAVDHHISFSEFASCNFLNAKSSSTCEFLYDIFQELHYKIDNRMAELMYLGIIRDSGGFMYDNTTSHTHYVVGKLIDIGIDFVRLNRQFMNTLSMQNALVLKIALNNLEFHNHCKFAISTITKSELRSIGATINDTGIVVSQLLSIEPVEVAVFATEVYDGIFKVSFRTKYDIDANAIAKVFGGGGHAKASGCQIYGTRGKVVDALLKTVGQFLREN